MKHRLYEGWILARDELTADQKQDLEAHLKECESCKQLAKADKALEKVFTSVQMSEPFPGFVNRWKVRLDERQMKAHRRQTSLILGILSFGATALVLPLMLETILVLISPEEALFALSRALIDWLSLLNLMIEIAITSLKSLFSIVPFSLWLLIPIIIVGTAVLGGYSLQRLGYLPGRERSSK
jgi:hypothetical protein